MRFRIIASVLAVTLLVECQGLTRPETGKDSQDGSADAVVGELLFCFGVTMRDIALNLDTVPIRQGQRRLPLGNNRLRPG